MKTRFGIHEKEYKITRTERQYLRARWSARLALWTLILGFVFLAGCGELRREQRNESSTVSPTSPVGTKGAPTVIQPTAGVAPSETRVGTAPTQTNRTPTANATSVAPAPTRPSPVVSTPTATQPSATGVQVVPPSSIALGIFIPQSNTLGENLDTYTRETGQKPAFGWLPMTWQDSNGSYRKFDPQMLEVFRTRGIMPSLTWEPSKGAVEAYPDRQVAVNQSEFSWKQIASGKHDSYLTQFAKDAAAYHYPFILRTLHEVDGTWYPWGYSVNGNTNVDDYIAAWKHIVDIFRRENATNVQFAWCPAVLGPDLVQRYGSMLKQVYPGDSYVDWVGLDGYGTAQNGYRPLQDVFKPTYDIITGFSTRPMILFEVGVAANPANQTATANWIKQGLLKAIPEQLPRVKVVVWFNTRDGQGRDYRLQTSPEAMAAWKQVVTSPLYQGNFGK